MHARAVHLERFLVQEKSFCRVVPDAPDTEIGDLLVPHDVPLHYLGNQLVHVWVFSVPEGRVADLQVLLYILRRTGGHPPRGRGCLNHSSLLVDHGGLHGDIFLVTGRVIDPDSRVYRGLLCTHFGCGYKHSPMIDVYWIFHYHPYVAVYSRTGIPAGSRLVGIVGTYREDIGFVFPEP